MSDLLQEDPHGRLDILVFRILGRIGESQAPKEWPLLERFVEQQCHEWLGPNGRVWK